MGEDVMCVERGVSELRAGIGSIRSLAEMRVSLS